MSKSIAKILHANDLHASGSYEALIWCFWLPKSAKSWAEIFPARMNSSDCDLLHALIQREPKKLEAGQVISFDHSPLQRWVCVVLSEEQDKFQQLSLARHVLKPLKEHGCQHVQIDLSVLPAPTALAMTDAWVAAAKALLFHFPKYGKADTKKNAAQDLQLDILTANELDLAEAQSIANHAELCGAINNQQRYLVMQAGNDLTPSTYIARLRKLAEQSDLDCSVITQKKLEAMGAGAFIAVAQGSLHQDAGIVKLSYNGGDKKTDKHLVLVGKGVTFDTGGHNLKSASGMFGMHRDMAGSALAYGVIALAAKEKWPIRVTAFLAIAENAIGPNAYKQNDVVTAMNGKTIEIVDTDAEGRMLLADALHLASLEKPQLLLDFATLTGACIRALSTIYSGVFTNRMELLQTLINAGRESGERVWPFPLDADFAEALKSDIADIKQCRVSGGVDHIEAALFLKEFVAKDLTWVHVDLAAAEHTGGLAHIDTEVTGFGLRFVSQFVRMHWDSCNNLHQRGL